MNGGLLRAAGLAGRMLSGARGPWRVTAVLTERCHLRCDFCQLWKDPDSGAPTEEWLQVFAANPSLRWVNLSGGELFAKEHLDQLLAGVVRALPRLYLLDFPTAGQRPEACEDSVRQLLATSVPRIEVTVSLDGGEELHDRLRGVEGAFARGLETYRRLRKLRDGRFGVHVGCTLTAQARDQASSLRRALRAEFEDFDPEHELHYNLAHHSGHYYRNAQFDELPEDPALEVLDERPFRASAVGWAEWVYARLARRARREAFPPTGCEAIHQTVFIAPNLTVYPCSIWDRPLGDLRDHDLSLRALLRTAAATEARREIDREACPGCFTPCEALPAMVAHPLRSTWAAWREGRGPRERPR